MLKKFFLLNMFAVLTLTLSGCWHHVLHVPPGQIKKQTAPGQLKKHSALHSKGKTKTK